MIASLPKIGTGFKGCVSYLMEGHLDNKNLDRVEWSSSRNLPTDNPAVVAGVMRATANQSKRSKKPVYHFSINFDPKDTDKLDPEKMEAMAEQTLDDLGLSEHQAFIVAHNDTEHKHMHVVVNKVHPETGKTWSNSMDYKRLNSSMKKQAKEYDLTLVPSKFDVALAKDLGNIQNASNSGEIGLVKKEKRHPLQLLTKLENETLKDDLGDLLYESKSWGTISEELDTKGYHLQKRGRGLILSDGEKYAKLSDMGNGLSKKKVEKRLDQSFDQFNDEEGKIKEQKKLTASDLLKVSRDERIKAAKEEKDRQQELEKELER